MLLPLSSDAGIHHTAAQQQVAAAGAPYTSSFLAQEQEHHQWNASLKLRGIFFKSKTENIAEDECLDQTN